MTPILYIDEFTRTSPSKDAMISILEKMGMTPIVFNGVSGRTMLSMGMLRWARRVIANNFRRLTKYQDAEIIFLEPSAWSVFRDEAPNLIGPSPIFSRCFLYDDWLIRHSDLLNLSPLNETSVCTEPTADCQNKCKSKPIELAHIGEAQPDLFQLSIPNSQLILLHEHCHQMALNPIGLSQRLLSLIPGTTVFRVGDSCCGMAGAYGYMKRNYDLSMQIGKPLFDAINQYPDAIVSAPGISCRKQILDGTGRHAFHPVELINLSFGSVGQVH